MTKLDVHDCASSENYINWREYSNIPSSSREPGGKEKKTSSRCVIRNVNEQI